MLANLGLAELVVLFLIFAPFITIIKMVGYIKIYIKAGKKAWAPLVPVYNLLVLLDIVQRPRWWAAVILLGLTFIFILSTTNILGSYPDFSRGLMVLLCLMVLILDAVLSMDLALRFGHDRPWGFFLIFILTTAGITILGFGDSKYRSLPEPVKG